MRFLKCGSVFSPFLGLESPEDDSRNERMSSGRDMVLRIGESAEQKMGPNRISRVFPSPPSSLSLRTLEDSPRRTSATYALPHTSHL